MFNYRQMMKKLLDLPACTLLTTGRTGTDYLQSLLDSHPQILTFNGILQYHAFWKTSACISAGNFSLADFLDEFIGKHIEKFKSRYDLFERKDQLGVSENQSIDIDTGRFKHEVMKLLDGLKVDSKNSLLAINAAYAMCLGQDMDKKTLFFHHLHCAEALNDYLMDFPQSKIIVMTRDPRANFVSGIENWRRYDSAKDRGLHLYLYIRRIFIDADVLKGYANPYIVIRIEDLGQEGILRRLAEWLGIPYNDCLKESTWGGLLWQGDRVSVKRPENNGLARNILKNQWEERLSALDKYVFNFLLFRRLAYYRYHFNPVNIWDAMIMPWLILFPLSYELRFFSSQYIGDKLRERAYRIIGSNIICYIRRVGLFLRYYFKNIRGQKFSHPLLA